MTMQTFVNVHFSSRACSVRLAEEKAECCRKWAVAVSHEGGAAAGSDVPSHGSFPLKG
jgi:hypothetical protein